MRAHTNNRSQTEVTDRDAQSKEYVEGSPENVPVVSDLSHPFPPRLYDYNVTLVESKEHNVILKV